MANVDTSIGGAGGSFPTTRWSVICDARDRDSSTARASLGELASIYWPAVYVYFRRKWSKSNEESKDLTQEFFAALCEKNILEGLSPSQGRFRHYVMTALDNFARMRYRHDHAQKRGGSAVHFTLDIGEGFEPQAEGSPEDAFRFEWARVLMDESIRELEKQYKESGRETEFLIFRLREVEEPEDADLTYEGIAKRFQWSVVDVKNALYRTRKRLREIVLGRIRDTVTNEADAEGELRELFGP